LTFRFNFFFEEESKALKTDSTGILRIDKKIEQIDSIYFNWQFEEFGIYPIDNKFIPRKDKIEEELETGYLKLEVFVDENLLGHPINNNETKLLVIGDNQLFCDLDYDPDIVYTGGILEKDK